VELHLILAADVVLSVVRQYLATTDSTALPARSSPAPLARKSTAPSAAVRRAQKSVVLLEVGNSWASGIILSSTGYILTNAHVVRPYLSTENLLVSSVSIRVRVEDGQHPPSFSWQPVELVFASSSCIDVALLRLKSERAFPPLVAASFALQTPSVGDVVFAIGYPLFFPTTDLQGCICTAGKVSKIVTIGRGKVGAIQTTASVHNGNSGGALVNA